MLGRNICKMIAAHFQFCFSDFHAICIQRSFRELRNTITDIIYLSSSYYIRDSGKKVKLSTEIYKERQVNKVEVYKKVLLDGKTCLFFLPIPDWILFVIQSLGAQNNIIRSIILWFLK